MIRLKTSRDIEEMVKPNRIVAECLALAGDMAKPGITTAEINDAVEKYIEKHNADAAFKGIQGSTGTEPFPTACCMSIDEQVVHGFPSATPLQEGQILSVDIGVKLNGWYGDAARTFIIGTDVDDDVSELVKSTKEALEQAIEHAKPGSHLSDIGHAVQSYVEKRGFSVVRDLVGHGIGKELHEEPQVPNYGKAGRGVKLREGMVIAIEPMINLGTYKVDILDDGWTVVTRDGKPSAHFEHTVAITSNGPRILTLDP
ncbi:MAG: type I methionyl aminopeptidase [Candidatus Electryonea clarkiae]|nr:type I methionyl aminopeptidase [Candidatus Electryonea clarkiae]MDP8288605.1 type I methionyl aminopeptidase [Candidatus Electryonea clarkiae]